MTDQHKVLAEGGFNTGRLYTARGQEVYWWLVEFNEDHHVVFFKDTSRKVHGYIETTAPGLVKDMRAGERACWIVGCYDRGWFETWAGKGRPNLEFILKAPADYDYGKELRI